MSAKQCILDLTKTAPVGCRWKGTLNEANAVKVEAQLRELFTGRRAAIASVLYCNTALPQLTLALDEPITDLGVNELHQVVWETSNFFWTLLPAPGTSENHEDFRYSQIAFQNDSVTITQRAAASWLCEHILKVMPHVDDPNPAR